MSDSSPRPGHHDLARVQHAKRPAWALAETPGVGVLLKNHQLLGRGATTDTDREFELDVIGQRITFGAGRVERVADELESLWLQRVLLVATGSARQAADYLTERLGDKVTGRVHRVVQHVPESEVARAREIAGNADGLVAIGGGSAIGLGKALAVETGLPLVAVPTTYSGSEMTPIYGITGEHKATGRDSRALPQVVVYDPVLSLDLPRKVTATSGMNALAHCVEALYAPDANPVTSLLAEEGIRVLTVALPEAVERPRDLSTRADALYGGYLAGAALAGAGSALHHTLCHVIGGSYSLGHGDLHAVLLPHVAAYNAAAAPDAMRLVAAAMGTTDAPTGLQRFAISLEGPADLRCLGLPEEALDDVAERAVTATGGRNPRPVDAPSLRRLLGDAYAGRPPGTSSTHHEHSMNTASEV